MSLWVTFHIQIITLTHRNLKCILDAIESNPFNFKETIKRAKLNKYFFTRNNFHGKAFLSIEGIHGDEKDLTSIAGADQGTSNCFYLLSPVLTSRVVTISL
jgi:hypothetical protein